MVSICRGPRHLTFQPSARLDDQVRQPECANECILILTKTEAVVFELFHITVCKTVVKWMFECRVVPGCVCVWMACSDVHWMEQAFFLNADEWQKVVCGTKWTTIMIIRRSGMRQPQYLANKCTVSIFITECEPAVESLSFSFLWTRKGVEMVVVSMGLMQRTMQLIRQMHVETENRKYPWEKDEKHKWVFSSFCRLPERWKMVKRRTRRSQLRTDSVHNSSRV